MEARVGSRSDPTADLKPGLPDRKVLLTSAMLELSSELADHCIVKADELEAAGDADAELIRSAPIVAGRG